MLVLIYFSRFCHNFCNTHLPQVLRVTISTAITNTIIISPMLLPGHYYTITTTTIIIPRLLLSHRWHCRHLNSTTTIWTPTLLSPFSRYHHLVATTFYAQLQLPHQPPHHYCHCRHNYYTINIKLFGPFPPLPSIMTTSIAIHLL